jgi:hypothetical protein
MDVFCPVSDIYLSQRSSMVCRARGDDLPGLIVSVLLLLVFAGRCQHEQGHGIERYRPAPAEPSLGEAADWAEHPGGIQQGV